jgi:hypothetical protein
LIHDNSNLRDYIYRTVLKTQDIPDNFYTIFVLLAMIFGVFVCCSIIEYIRRRVFGIWENSKWFNNLVIKVQHKFLPQTADEQEIS